MTDITRRTACALSAAALLAPAAHAGRSTATVEQWGCYEITLSASPAANPFDVGFSAVFDNGVRQITVPGFYDGEGQFRLRFMPPEQGRWQWTSQSDLAALNGHKGSLSVSPPAKDNHGPVAVAATYHFAYADGTPYRPFGTTSYAWTHRNAAMQQQTLKTLAAAPFNKLRFAIFPNETIAVDNGYPFAGAPGHWDFSRFNPAFFQALDKQVAALGRLGIEADIILFHPYDHGKFGFDSMPAEIDARYVRYVVARLSAYRHVWWSLANEYDDMKAKSDASFDVLFQIVAKADPYGHLRSIHHNRTLYDYDKPWVTHSSIQNGSAVIDDGRAVLYRDVWKKPVVFDEVKYEGNLTKRWGNLSGEEMVKRCWYGTLAGTYVGHGESIVQDGTLFLGDGGILRGTSPARIGFLRQIVEAGPKTIEPIDKWQERHIGGEAGRYYLTYFGEAAPTSWRFALPKQNVQVGDRFSVEIIDSWAMIITPVEPAVTVTASGDYDVTADRVIALPGKPYQALRIRKL